MTSYTNPIILNLDVDGNELKGTFTYKTIKNENDKFLLQPISQILWKKKKLINCIYNTNTSKVEIRCTGCLNETKEFKYINGFNLKKLKITKSN